jgi:hypothetical protein
VLPPEGSELTEAQARVEGCRPQRPLIDGQGSDQLRGFGWRGDSVTLAANRWKLEPRRRVDRDFAPSGGAAADRPEGHDRVADRARVGTLGE